MSSLVVGARRRLFLLRATSGLTLGAGLVSVVAAILLGTTTRTAGFLPGFADPLNLSLTACLFLAPVGAGTGAAQMAAFHRLGLAELASTTPRASAAAKWFEVRPVIAWQLAAYVVLTGLILLRSDLRGAFSPAMLLLPLQAVVLLTVATILGAAVSDAYRPRLIAPIVTASVFALLYVLALQTGPASRFSPVYTDIFYRVPLQPDRGLLAAMITVLVGFGGVAAATLCVRSFRRPLIAVAASTCLVAGTVGVLRASTDRTEFRAQPAKTYCQSQDAIRLCVWPESSRSLPASLDALVRVTAAANPFISTPDTFFETGLARDETADAEYAVPSPGEETEIISAILAVLPTPCATSDSQRAFGELANWLSSKADYDDGAPPSQKTSTIQALSIAEQRTWAQDAIQTVQKCAPA